MTEQEAINLLVKVCRAYKGNADEHDLLSTALNVVNAKVFPPEVAKKESGKGPKIVNLQEEVKNKK